MKKDLKTNNNEVNSIKDDDKTVNNQELNKISNDVHNKQYKRRIIILLLLLFAFVFSLNKNLGGYAFLNRLFKVDSPTPPEISVDSKEWSDKVNIFIEKDAESSSGVDHYEYCMVSKGTSKDKCEWKKIADKKITAAKSGEWDVYFRGISKNGTEGRISNKITILVDNDSPVINSVSIYKITGHEIYLSLDVSDNLSGVESIIYAISGQEETTTTTDLNHIFENLDPDTEYIITITVIDKAGNTVTVQVPVKTLKEGEVLDMNDNETGDPDVVVIKDDDKDDNKDDNNNNTTEENKTDDNEDKLTCNENNFVMPKVTIEPDNEKFSPYKDVTIDYGDNSCKHEYSLDKGKTWHEYTGKLRFFLAKYVMARSVYKDQELNTGLIRVKYIDPVVPKISLDDVPSEFEYGEYYELPTEVAFGEAGGSYECFVDGNKEGSTALLKVGEHTIKCYAYGNNGLTTELIKNIKVNYRNDITQAWNGWVTLDLNYPVGSVNRQWRLFDPNKVITLADTQYQWQDYTGPITIRLEDVSKVRISYELDGKYMINYNSSDLLVNILPSLYMVSDNEQSLITISYDPTATGRYYRLNNGDWQEYSEPFYVNGNTLIEAKVERIRDITDGNGNVVDTVTDVSYETLEILQKPIYHIPGQPPKELDYPYGVFGYKDTNACLTDENYNDLVELTVSYAAKAVISDGISEKILETDYDYFMYKTINFDDPNYNMNSFAKYTGKFTEIPYTESSVCQSGDKCKALKFNLPRGTVLYLQGFKNVGTGTFSVIDTYLIENMPYCDGSTTGPGADKPNRKLVKLEIVPEEKAIEVGKRTPVKLEYNEDEISSVMYNINDTDYKKYTGEFTAGPYDVIYAYALPKDDENYANYKTLKIEKKAQEPSSSIAGPKCKIEYLDEYSARVTLDTEFGAKSISYRFSNTSSQYKTYTTPIIVGRPSDVYAYYVRQSDNVRSREVRCEVDDYNWPPPGQGPNPVRIFISPNTKAPTDRVLIKIKTANSELTRYSIDGGFTYQNYTGPFYVYENIKIIAYAQNSAGRKYSAYSVTNIGDAPSGLMMLANSNINISFSPPTCDNTILTSAETYITYDDDATEKYYRIGNSELWQEYKGPFNIDYNTTIYAYEKTPNGVAMTAKMIDCFEKGLPNPIITSNPDNTVTSTIDTITIQYGKNSVQKLYSIDDGPVQDYTGPFDIKENSIIQAISVDADGNTTTDVYFVENIQPIPKIIEKYEDYSIIKFNFPNTSINREYKVDSEINWKKYPDKGDISNPNGKYINYGILIIRSDKFLKYYNANDGTLIIDGYNYANDYYVYDGDPADYAGLIELRFDTPNANMPTIIPDKTLPLTAEEVSIQIVYPDESVDKEYKLVYEDGTSTNWLPYTDSFIIDKNNTTIYARGKDQLGVYTKVANYLVNNIVTTGSVSVKRNYQSLEVSLTDISSVAEADFYEFSLDGVTYNQVSDNYYKFDNLLVNENYTVYGRMVDVDGMVHGPYMVNTSTLSFAKPQVYSDPDENIWSTSKEIIIDYHDSYYNDIEYQKLYSTDNGLTWQEYTGPFEVTNNVSVIAKTYVDDNNFMLSDIFKTTTIDTTAPVINNVSFYIGSSRIRAIVQASDSESGIQTYSYSLDGINYIELTNEKYNFIDLDMNTEYTIYVKVKNPVGLESDVYEETITTNELQVPKYTKVTSLNDRDQDINSEWGYAKRVEILSPYTDEDTILEYSLDDGETWIDYSQKVSVVRKENGTIIARVRSGRNIVTASSLTVTKIDRSEPTIDLSNLPGAIEVGSNYSLPSSNTFNNIPSGGKYFTSIEGIDLYTVSGKLTSNNPAYGLPSGNPLFDPTAPQYIPFTNAVIALVPNNDLINVSVTSTNNDGSYSFKNILEDAYELYYVPNKTIAEVESMTKNDIKASGILKKEIKVEFYNANNTDYVNDEQICYLNNSLVASNGLTKTESALCQNNYLSNDDEYVVVEKTTPDLTDTSSLPTGVYKLLVTASTGAGHIITTERKLGVYTTLKYNVDSILDGIKKLDLVDGDYKFIVNTGSEEKEYDVELWNYNSETITNETKKCDYVNDYKMCILKYNGDLTIENGGSIIPYARKKGLTIYVNGKFTNNGTVSVTGKGAVADPENVYLWKNDDNYYEYIPATSGIPGAAEIVTSRASKAGIKGQDGYFRGTGAGGSGAISTTSNGQAIAGSGAAGTSYSGGAGGGAYNGAGSTTLLEKATSGKANGTAGVSDPSVIKAGGANNEYSGGLLVIYADEYENNGLITASAKNYAKDSTYQVSGGGAGGGSVNIFYKDLIEKGTVTVDGQKNTGFTYPGGEGGKGTITYSKVESKGLKGTSVNPYIVNTAEDFKNMLLSYEDYKDGYYVINNDIDLIGINFESIGTDANPFSGHIYGNDHKITGLTTALFNVLYKAEIKDLILENVNINTTTDYTGAIANKVIDQCNISNVKVTGNISSTASYVGGIIGYVFENSGDKFTLTDTEFTGNINGLDYVGGLVGSIKNQSNSNLEIKASSYDGVVTGRNYIGGLIGNIEQNYYSNTELSDLISKGKVTATGNNVGGLIGYVNNKDKVSKFALENSFASSEVKGVNYVGGVIGQSLNIVDAEPNIISKTYFEGSVVGTQYAGGLAGYAIYSKFENTFSTGSVSANTYVASLAGSVSNTSIVNSYAIGAVSYQNATSIYGGLVAYAENSQAVNSYYAAESTGVRRTALGKNYRLQRFVHDNIYADYDFAEIWDIDDNSSSAYLKGLEKPASVSNLSYLKLDGIGTEDDPYIIKNAEQFRSMTYEITAYYKQANDIDFNNETAVVGTDEKAMFSGVYDGNNFEIKNIKINDNINYTAIFGYVSGASFVNMNINNIEVLGQENTGGLIGRAYTKITIDNVSIDGTITGTKYTGGLIGQFTIAKTDPVYASIINNVNVNANVTGKENTGGLIGRIDTTNTATITISINDIVVSDTSVIKGEAASGGVIGQVYNNGAIETFLNNVDSQATVTSNTTNNTTYNNIGGIIGIMQNVDTGKVYINNSHSSANVTGKENVGGIVGYFYNQSSGLQRVYRSYFDGTVTGTGNRVGGIAGYAYSARNDTNTIRESYSEGSVTGLDNVGNLIGETYNSEVFDSFTTGSVNGRNIVGSLIGHVNYTKIYRIYSTGHVTASGSTNIGGLVGKSTSSVAADGYYLNQTVGVLYSPLGTKKKGFQMVKQDTYENYDFSSIWNIDENNSTAYLRNVEKPKLITTDALGFITLEGEGTESEPYLIHNLKELDDIRYDETAYYKVVNDIDGENREFKPIGEPNLSFAGHIDGNNHTISNILISGNKDYNSLIAYSNNADIKDLTIEGFNVTGKDNSSLLIGYNTNDLTLDNITVKSSTLNSNGNNVGSLVGYQKNTTAKNINITNIDSEVTVNGNNNVGGIFGYMSIGSSSVVNIEDVKNNTTMTVNTTDGGIIGRLEIASKSKTNIKNIEIEGTINGKDGNIGGFAGYIQLNEDSKTFVTNIKNSSNITGNVAGGIIARIDNNANSVIQLTELKNEGTITKYSNKEFYGGLIGYASNPSIGTIEITDSYNKANISGYRYVGGLIGYSQNTGYSQVYEGSQVNYISGTVKLTNTYNENPITGQEYIGGLVGYHYDQNRGINFEMETSYSKGVVSATGGNYVGGLIGRITGPANSLHRIKQVYSSANVSSVNGTTKGSYVGGLIGQADYVDLYNSFSLGSVTANDYAAGLIGGNSNVNIVNSYAVGLVDINGTNTGGLVGTTNTTTATDTYFSSEIATIIRPRVGLSKKLRYMVEEDLYASWDKENIWAQEENELPYLKGLEKPSTGLKKSEYTVYELQGKGTENDPYIINNLTDYNYIKYELDAYYKLNADLDLGGNNLSPIGESTVPFTGDFNGNNHTISNFKMNGAYIGIFSTTKDAKIYDLNIENFTFTNGSYAGSLVGSSSGSLDVDNINVTSNIAGTGTYVGGLIGNSNGELEINDITITGNVTSNGNYVGGLVGGLVGGINTDNITIEGNVNGSSYVGGLVGSQTAGTDSNATNINYHGDIRGVGYVGSMFGNNANTEEDLYLDTLIINSTITATGSNVGGIVGYSSGDLSIKNTNLTTTVTSNNTNVGGIVGYYLRTIDQNSVFEDIDATITQIKGTNNTGGLFGYMSNNIDGLIKINNVELNGTLTGAANVGGVAGRIENKNGGTEITGVILTLPITSTGDYVGNIAGYLSNSSTGIVTIKDNTLNQGITSSRNYIGGLIGYNELTGNGQTNIENISMNYDVSGISYVGGFIGYTKNTSATGTINVKNMHVKGNISSTGDYVGGLVGKSEGTNTGGTSFDTTYYDGDITGRNYVGGLIGQMVQTGKGTNQINFSYALGNVTTTGNYIGGLVGEINAVSGSYAAITKAYSDNNITGNTYVGSVAAKTTYGVIRDVYSLAPVTGTDYLSAFIVVANYTAINDSYTLAEINLTANTIANIGGFVQSASNSTATNSYFSSRFTKANRTALGINISYERMLTIDDCYILWDFMETWDIVYEQGPAFLRGLPKADFEGRIEYTPMDGEGTEENPYLVRDYLDLTDIITIPDAHYKLLNDIEKPNDVVFYPIGTLNNPFMGVLDGDGHKLINFDISSNLNELGIFGVLDGATIKNLSIENMSISSTMTNIQKVGGLVGYAKNTTIEDVDIEGSITSVGSMIGGLIGLSEGSTSINNITNNVNIGTGGTSVGGLIGKHTSTENSNTSITNVTASGTIKGTNKVSSFIGEYINSNNSTLTISDITLSGELTGTGNVGGLIAYNENNDTSSVNISNIKNTTTLSATSNAGGLIGNISVVTGASANISNITLSGKITNTGTNTGGLIGTMTSTSTVNNTITNIKNELDISAKANTGGLIGNIVNSNTGTTNITSTYYEGTINITDTVSNVGGLIGTSTGNTGGHVIISKSYASSTIYGYESLGGLIGYANYNDIDNSFAYSMINGRRAGQFVGRMLNSKVNNSYVYGSIATVTEESKIMYENTNNEFNNFYCQKYYNNESNICTPLEENDFADSTKFIGFDFENIWNMSSKPYLKEFTNSSDLFTRKPIKAEAYVVRSLEEFFSIEGLQSGNYKVEVKANSETVTHYINLYVYDGNTTFNENQKFGGYADVFDSAANNYAKHMVAVKVNGDLTINDGVKIEPYYTNYGGPKGFTIYVTGTLTNNGTIDNSHGARAEGQNVYLYRNPNGSYEFVPAVGAVGAVGWRNTTPVKAVGRQTGGGGKGSWRYNDEGGGDGATGTSYSGGPGGGAGYISYSGGINGGAGSNGHIWHSTSEGGGAGNPAGCADYCGGNGTGGLLIIYANSIQNTSTGYITAKGANGSGGGEPGGSSGGGSINIFYSDKYNNSGTLNAESGQGALRGGNGTITTTKLGDSAAISSHPIISVSNSTNSIGREITISYSDNYTHQYSLDGGVTWNNYTNSFVVNDNVTIIARSVDGNVTISSSSYKVQTIAPLTISKVVIDTDRFEIPNLNLVIVEGDIIHTATTDANGLFSVSDLRLYDLKLYIVDSLEGITEMSETDISNIAVASATYNKDSEEIVFNNGYKAVNSIGETENNLYDIEGTINDENGNPVNGGTIVTHSEAKYASVDANGHFKVSGIEEGKHHIYYVPDKSIEEINTLSEQDIAALENVVSGKFRTFELANIYISGNYSISNLKITKVELSLDASNVQITYNGNETTLDKALDDLYERLIEN